MRVRRMSPRWLAAAVLLALVLVRAWGLSLGFHGFRIHAVGVCDPNAVDPATGQVTPFFSAGGHHNPAATSHPTHGGDLPVLLADQRGQAAAEAVTDRFGVRELLAGDGSAVIVHALPDNWSRRARPPWCSAPSLAWCWPAPPWPAATTSSAGRPPDRSCSASSSWSPSCRSAGRCSPSPGTNAAGGWSWP